MIGGLKRLRPAALMLAAVLMLGACESAEDRLAGHIEDGQALAAEGALEKATVEYRNALSIDANSVPAHMGMADIYERQKNYPAMIAHLNKVVQVDPVNAPALVKLGQLMLLAQRLDEANENATAAVTAAPDNADALALKAGVSLRLGNVDAAEEAAKKAIAIDPDQPNAHSVLVGARLNRGDTDGAMDLALKATEAMPNDLGLALVRLRLLESKSGEEEAGAYLRQLVDQFPEQTPLRQSLAQWLHKRGEKEEALEQLKKIAELTPDDPDSKLRVAQYILVEKGRGPAREELERLIASEDDDSPYEVALSELDFGDGDEEAGRARLRRSIEASLARGDTAGADRTRLILARRLLNASDLDGAGALAAEVLEHDSGNADALLVRATIAYEREDYNAAILDLRTALSASPDDSRLLLLSARTNLKMGSTDLAGERLAAAMQASGYREEITLEYVNFLKSQGRADSTLPVLQEAVRRNPGKRGLLTELAAAQLRGGDWSGADETAKALASVDSGAAKRVEAASLSGQERYDESLDVLDGLVEDEGAESSALAALVRVQMQAGEVAAARDFLDGVLAENPKNSQALLLRAGVSLSEKKTDEAEADIKAAVAAKPEDAAPHLSLARFYYSVGKADAAIEAAKAGIEASEDPTGLHLYLGGLHESRHETDEAIGQYRALYELRPDSVVAANNLASMLADHKSDDAAALDEAERIARPLRSLEVPAFQDTYGWIEHLRGNNEQALRWLAPAAEALPGNPYVRYHAGVVYAALGDTAEAREHLKAATEKGPDSFTKFADAKAALDGLPATE